MTSQLQRTQAINKKSAVLATFVYPDRHVRVKGQEGRDFSSPAT